jgi:hypothetical protein
MEIWRFLGFEYRKDGMAVLCGMRKVGTLIRGGGADDDDDDDDDDGRWGYQELVDIHTFMNHYGGQA